MNDTDRGTRASTVKDPVCQMDVSPEAAAGSMDYAGATYYFCSSSCLEKFRASPGEYMGGQGREAPPSVSGEDTCPMHPEVVSSEPGSGPICGMALEAKMVTAEEGPNPELKDMSRRFWISLILALPVFVIAMGEMLLAHSLDPAIYGRI